MTACRRECGEPRRGLSLMEVLVAIAIVATLIGLSLGAVQKAREAAARAVCQNRARQLGLALHGYHDARGALPAGHSSTAGNNPQPHMSWMTRLLPFVEQQASFDESLAAYRLDPSFLTPPHRPVLGRPLPAYTCPADVRAAGVKDFRVLRVAFTSFQGVSGTAAGRGDGVLYSDSNVRFAGVTDGLSNTLAVGERPPSLSGEFGWWYAGWGQAIDGSADSVLGVRELKTTLNNPSCPRGPYAYGEAGTRTECDFLRFWSFHPGGANFVFADGSVRFLAYSADAVLPALATRAGGESVEIP